MVAVLLIGVVDVGAVVADIPYSVDVNILLARIDVHGTVVRLVRQAVAVDVGITHVTQMVAVEIFLHGVGIVRTVVAKVAAAVAVGILLSGVEDAGAHINRVLDAVMVRGVGHPGLAAPLVRDRVPVAVSPEYRFTARSLARYPVEEDGVQPWHQRIVSARQFGRIANAILVVGRWDSGLAVAPVQTEWPRPRGSVPGDVCHPALLRGSKAVADLDCWQVPVVDDPIAVVVQAVAHLRAGADVPEAAQRPAVAVHSSRAADSRILRRARGADLRIVLVDQAVAVVVQAVADLRSTGVHRGAGVVAVALTIAEAVPVVVHALPERVTAAVLKKTIVVTTAPHDHEASRPDGCVSVPSQGSVGRGRSLPSVGSGIVPAAGVGIKTIVPTPYDHAASRPDGGVILPTRRGARRGRRLPGVGGGVVPAAGVQKRWVTVATPDDHAASRPDGCVLITHRGGARRGSRCRVPGVGDGVVPAAGINTVRRISLSPAPHDHAASCPDGRVQMSGRGGVRAGRRFPGVVDRVVPAAGVFRCDIKTTPYDHATSRPDGGVVKPRRRGVCRARWEPFVPQGVVPAARAV